MANLKRAAAFALSAAMFLQPMTASAATWGNIMSAIRNGQKFYKDGNTSAEVNEQGELTVSGGSLDDGVIMRGDNDGFKWVSSIILKNIDVKWESASGVGIYVEKSGTEDQKYRFTVGENATVRGMVIINAGNQKTYSKGTEIELNIEKNAKIRMGNVQANAINGGSVISTNQGWIQGEYMGCADGANSTADLTNLEGGQIAALDIFARGENAQMTAKNEGSAGELLANALAGGVTTATNDGDVSLRTSGWSKGEGSSLTITNNGNSGMMSVESYLKGQATATNKGLAEGGMGGYAENGRVKLNNNGEVEGNMAVGTGNHGYAGIRNGRDGTVYGDIKGWTNGQNSMVTIVNLGKQKPGESMPDLKAAVFADEPEDEPQGEDTQKTYHDQADVKETVVSKDAQPGDAGEGVLTGENRGEGMVVIEDQNSGTASVNGKKADAMLNVTSSTTQAEIQSQLAALPIWEKPGEYTVLIKCVGENDEVTYEAVTILVEGDEEPAEGLDLSEEAFRHEMEMKRQAGAVGGVYGSPYWVKQLYLGYHSYNLRLFVGETRENFREELSWSADGSKSVSLRVNDENPEKLTMRFDEKVLEVLERTNITTVTLLNKSGAAVMQYNVSDLRAAYDGFGLDGADQLVVGGADDDVMKIGADGQLVPVES